MRILGAYFRRHWKLLFLLAGCLGICSAVFYLYGLPLESVGYAFVLCFSLGLALFAVGYVQFLRRHRELERLLVQVREKVLPLPPPGGLLEDYTLWAHQIKTPIAAMGLLLQEEPHPELEGELLKIEQYVEMVLGYLRLGSESTDYVFRDCGLDALVRQAVRKYARLFILKKISLDFQETGKTVLTDEKWLSFVIEQLLSNAVKYTPEGGRVRIYGDGDTLVIADSGIGIQPEDLPRVFEKGFTGFNGREDKKSTGIGLCLCRQVMDRLNHDISIASRPGQGTLVRLDLSRDRKRVE